MILKRIDRLADIAYPATLDKYVDGAILYDSSMLDLKDCYREDVIQHGGYCLQI